MDKLLIYIFNYTKLLELLNSREFNHLYLYKNGLFLRFLK